MSHTFLGSRLCKTLDLGTHGNLFGGRMMEWADEEAAVFAHKYTKEPRMVTKMIGQVMFLKPVKEGQVISFFISDAKIRNTSVSFTLEARVDNDPVFTGTQFVFVALDKNGKKKQITEGKWVLDNYER